jgi:hypothetical protein
VFGFLTLDGNPEQDLLLDQAAAEEFLRSLPLDDPLQTLKVLCEAISTFTNKAEPRMERLSALIGLDRRTERLCEQLLVNSVERGARSSPPASAIWQAVLELSTAFAHAYEQFLRRVRDSASNKASIEHTPALIVHLFRHRRIESLLALFRYEQLGPRRWRELNEAYQFAHSRQLAKGFVQTDSGRADAGSTPEREYLSILLLQLLNDGQLTLRESLWASRWVHTASKALSLEPRRANGTARAVGLMFALDLAGTEGLKRPPYDPEAHLYLDPTPVLSAIDQDVKRLRDSRAGPDASQSAHGQQLAFLGKIRRLLSPKPIRTTRRGERETGAPMTVQFFAGFSSIIRMLHDQSQQKPVAPTAAPPRSGGDEITITELGGNWPTAGDEARSSILPTSEETSDPSRDVWRMKNRSESGTLLRGRVDAVSRVIPGSLIVFRVAGDEQWTVAIVRRLKRFVRNNVEIAVEHIGRGPQGVTISADPGPHAQATASTADASGRFAGLYLREIMGHPEAPLKTLLLPAFEFKLGRAMTLLSTTAHYGLRLKEPLEVQAEFAWAPFEVVTKQRPSHLGDKPARSPVLAP